MSNQFDLFFQSFTKCIWQAHVEFLGKKVQEGGDDIWLATSVKNYAPERYWAWERDSRKKIKRRILPTPNTPPTSPQRAYTYNSHRRCKIRPLESEDYHLLLHESRQSERQSYSFGRPSWVLPDPVLRKQPPRHQIVWIQNWLLRYHWVPSCPTLQQLGLARQNGRKEELYEWLLHSNRPAKCKKCKLVFRA